MINRECRGMRGVPKQKGTGRALEEVDTVLALIACVGMGSAYDCWGHTGWL